MRQLKDVRKYLFEIDNLKAIFRRNHQNGSFFEIFKIARFFFSKNSKRIAIYKNRRKFSEMSNFSPAVNIIFIVFQDFYRFIVSLK